MIYTPYIYYFSNDNDFSFSSMLKKTILDDLSKIPFIVIFNPFVKPINAHRFFSDPTGETKI